MNFWDSNVWTFISQMSIIFVLILVANTIRRKVKFIRNSLLPSSVIAGVLLFILKFIPFFSRWIDENFMEVLTYHALGLGFVALSLKAAVKAKHKKDGVILNSGIITVNGYLIQAMAGLVITIGLAATVLPEFFPAAGLLLPMGFGQGTGQALNFGNIYEGLGFTQGTAFGLSIAAIGFLVACIVGVIYMNFLKKKGKLDVQLQRKDQSNDIKVEVYKPDEAPLSESVDKMTIQFGFIFAVYAMTYGLIALLSFLSETYLGKFGTNTLKPLFWGFNFLIGTVIAILVKKIIAILKARGIMKHTYINDHMMERISGLFFDIMIVAGLAAINWQDLSGILIPLLLVCIGGTILTFVYINFICKKIYPEYPYEAFFSIFGMLTGTASTGMILLREIDPNYETPASHNLVLQQLPAILFGAPLLLLMTFAASGGIKNALIMLGIVSVLFIIYNIILMRSFIFKRKVKEVATE